MEHACLPIDFVDREHVHELSATARNDLDVVGALYSSKGDYGVDERIMERLSKQTTTDIHFLADSRKLAKRMNDGEKLGILNPTKEPVFKEDVLSATIRMGSFLGRTYSTPVGFGNLAMMYFSLPTVMLLFQLVLSILPVVLTYMYPQDYSLLSAFLSKCSAHVFHPLIKWACEQREVHSTLSKWATFAFTFIYSAYYVHSHYKYISAIIECVETRSKVQATLQELVRECQANARTLKYVAEACDQLPSHAGFKKHVERLVQRIQARESEIGEALEQGLGHSLHCFHHLFSEFEELDLSNKVYLVAEYARFLALTVDTITDASFESASPAGAAELRGVVHPTMAESNDLTAPVANMIISGENGSGKTTAIRTIMTNQILTQILGGGFYDSFTVSESNLFESFGSYMNVGDVAGEKSLFEAQTEHCSTIKKCLARAPNAKHLCGFDELFSGTNPADASAASIRFLESIRSNYPRTVFLATTHHVNICDHFDSSKELGVETYMMVRTGADFKLVQGISRTSNAMDILNKSGLYEA